MVKLFIQISRDRFFQEASVESIEFPDGTTDDMLEALRGALPLLLQKASRRFNEAFPVPLARPNLK